MQLLLPLHPAGSHWVTTSEGAQRVERKTFILCFHSSLFVSVSTGGEKKKDLGSFFAVNVDWRRRRCEDVVDGSLNLFPRAPLTLRVQTQATEDPAAMHFKAWRGQCSSHLHFLSLSLWFIVNLCLHSTEHTHSPGSPLCAMCWFDVMDGKCSAAVVHDVSGWSVV